MLLKAMKSGMKMDLIGLYQSEYPRSWKWTLQALRPSKLISVTKNFSDLHMQKAEALLNNISSARELCADTSIEKGFPSAFVYDDALKKESVGALPVNSNKLKKYFAQAFNYLEQYKSIVENENIKHAIISHPTNIRFSTLLWVLVSNKIPVYVTNYRNGHMTIRRYDTPEQFFFPHDDSPIPSDISDMEEKTKQVLIRKGKTYMDLVREGDESEFARVRVYGNGKKYFTDKEHFYNHLEVDSRKPLVVIMGNCWPDFPNGYGPTWFSDYVDWFKVTLRAIKELKECIWLLKPHPAEVEYGQQTTLKSIVGGSLPEGIFYWPNQASGVDLAEYASGIVTARGTSGVEYAMAGLNVVVGASTPYTSHHFTNVADSEDQYVKYLSQMHKHKRLSVDKQNKAALYSALTFSRERHILQMPYGYHGQKLYKGLPEFINRQSASIDSEVREISRWLKSGHNRYHTWRTIETVIRTEEF